MTPPSHPWHRIAARPKLGTPLCTHIPPPLAVFLVAPTTSCRVHPVAIHRPALPQSLHRDTLDTFANCASCHEHCTPSKHPELLTSTPADRAQKNRCLTPLGEERRHMTSPSCWGGLGATITTPCGLSVERRTPEWGLAGDGLGIHLTRLGWATCVLRRIEERPAEDIENRLNFRGLERPPFRRPNHPPGTKTVDDRALATLARLEGRPRSRASEDTKRLLRRDRGATESRDGR